MWIRWHQSIPEVIHSISHHNRSANITTFGIFVKEFRFFGLVSPPGCHDYYACATLDRVPATRIILANKGIITTTFISIVILWSSAKLCYISGEVFTSFFFILYSCVYLHILTKYWLYSAFSLIRIVCYCF